MTLSYSYLLPSPSGPSRVLQRGRSPVPPTLLLLFAHTILTIFCLGSETLLKFASALTPRRLCLFVTAPPRAQLWPHCRGGIRHLPRMPLLLPLCLCSCRFSSDSLFIQIPSLLRGLVETCLLWGTCNDGCRFLSSRTAGHPLNPLLVLKAHSPIWKKKEWACGGGVS